MPGPSSAWAGAPSRAGTRRRPILRKQAQQRTAAEARRKRPGRRRLRAAARLGRGRRRTRAPMRRVEAQYGWGAIRRWGAIRSRRAGAQYGADGTRRKALGRNKGRNAEPLSRRGEADPQRLRPWPGRRDQAERQRGTVAAVAAALGPSGRAVSGRPGGPRMARSEVSPPTPRDHERMRTRVKTAATHMYCQRSVCITIAKCSFAGAHERLRTRVKPACSAPLGWPRVALGRVAPGRTEPVRGPRPARAPAAGEGTRLRVAQLSSVANLPPRRIFRAYDEGRK